MVRAGWLWGTTTPAALAKSDRKSRAPAKKTSGWLSAVTVLHESSNTLNGPRCTPPCRGPELCALPAIMATVLRAIHRDPVPTVVGASTGISRQPQHAISPFDRRTDALAVLCGTPWQPSAPKDAVFERFARPGIASIECHYTPPAAASKG